MITLQFQLEPLALAAAVHAAIIALALDAPGHCATPLLAHPLSQPRLRRFSAVMHTTTVAATPLGTAIARHGEYECADVVRFLAAVATVVPVVLMAHLPQAAQQAPAVPPSDGLQPEQPASKLHIVLSRRLNAALLFACGCRLPPPLRPVALAWLFSLLWVLASIHRP